MAQTRKWSYQATVNIKADNYSIFLPVEAGTLSEAFDKVLDTLKKDKKGLPDRVVIKRNNDFTIV